METPEMVKNFEFNAVPPSSGLTCPQETEGHAAAEPGAPGEVRQEETGHLFLRCLVFGLREQKCCSCLCCQEGLPVMSLW